MIELNLRDSRPFYQQIKDNVRKLMISGALSADDKLPSVRELAAQLQINPNTIQRAYRELEAEGCIYSLPGKGSFISDASAETKRRRGELEKTFDETVSELMFLGAPAGELKAKIDSIAEGRENR